MYMIYWFYWKIQSSIIAREWYSFKSLLEFNRNYGPYHVRRRAILIVLESLQGHPTNGSVLVITETMVILREEISRQSRIS